MTVSNSFLTLIDRIQPLQGELNHADSHTATIEARLEKCFQIKKFGIIGSHSRGTAIRTFSDVDLFVVFSRDDARWGGRYIDSKTFVNRVKSCLAGRYLGTVMRRDLQALVVKFSAGNYPVDIVPAFFEGMEEAGGTKFPTYCIPDGSGAWLITSPAVHNKFISEANQKSGGKLYRTVQLLKFWSACRIPSISINSFHLELLLSSEDTCVGIKSYSSCVTDAFRLLHERQCRPLRDPTKLSGIVAAAKTEQQRENLFRAVELSYVRSMKALNAELNGRVANSKYFWNLVFNGRFPLNG